MTTTTTQRIIVIGGGPAGMMAAAAATQNGAQVILIEKNKVLGRKMATTGGGRCNITNMCEIEELIESVQRNPYFLYSAFYAFTKEDIIALLEKEGVKVKVEAHGKVFPVSNKATDVIGAFERHLQKSGVDIKLGKNVQTITKKKSELFQLKLQDGTEIKANKVIIATGGMSASATGSTGDGYKFAQKLGHTLTDKFYPSVVPLKTKETFVKDLQGTSLGAVGIKLKLGKKILFENIGDMIFTHFGLSGPVILKASAYLTMELEEDVSLYIDIYPDETEKETDTKLVELLAKDSNKNIENIMPKLLPEKLVQVLLNLSHIHAGTKGRDITKKQRQTLLSNIKNMKFTITGNMGYNPAVTTAGGVITDEVNPSTMESKIVEGLYLVGEVLDVNAYTGGYNLQTCYSTGYLAGLSASSN